MDEQLELPPEFLQGWIKDVGPGPRNTRHLDRCHECGAHRFEHMPPITHPFVEVP